MPPSRTAKLQESLQPSKWNIRHFKHGIPSLLFFFVVPFCPARSGSGYSGQKKSMRIQIENTAKNYITFTLNARKQRYYETCETKEKRDPYFSPSL